MEVDPSSPEEIEQADPGDQGSPRSAQVRSYECTFCQRGFSNAQALGGHMNIHRKDRAKLKQPPNFSQFPFNIPPKSAPSIVGGDDDRGFMFKSDPCWIVRKEGESELEEIRVSDKRPRQLSLFVETPPRGWRCEGFVQQPASVPEVEELDLELRLGPHRRSGTLREFL